jgi:hypothetical protein
MLDMVYQFIELFYRSEKMQVIQNLKSNPKKPKTLSKREDAGDSKPEIKPQNPKQARRCR